MSTCKKRSDRRITLLDALLRDESSAKTWKFNEERDEGFSDSFSYFGNMLRQVTTYM
jgi:hypothetical protein